GALAYWGQPSGYLGGTGHTVMGSDQGVTEAVTPQIGSIAMFEPATNGDGDYIWDGASNTYVPCAPGTGTHTRGYYHDHAGLSILTKDNGTWKAYDGTGADVTAAVSSAVSVLNSSMYDARQAGGTNTRIRITQINLAALAASGHFPSNGLL